MRGSRAPRGLGTRKKLSGRNYTGDASALNKPWGGDDQGRIVAPFPTAPGMAPIITIPINDEEDDGTLEIETAAHRSASSLRRIAPDSTKTRYATQFRTLADFTGWLMTQPFGSGLWLGDDFLGSTIDAGIWNTIGANYATIDDSANGGFGALQAQVALNTKQFLITRPLAIGATDFGFRARIRYVSFDGSTNLLLGVLNSVNVGAGTFDGPNSLCVAKAGATTALFDYSGGTLGQVVGLGSTYIDIAMFAIGGIAYAFVNGVASANTPRPWTGNPSAASFGVFITQGNAGAPSDIRVDALKLWVKR